MNRKERKIAYAIALKRATNELVEMFQKKVEQAVQHNQALPENVDPLFKEKPLVVSLEKVVKYAKGKMDRDPQGSNLWQTAWVRFVDLLEDSMLKNLNVDGKSAQELKDMAVKLRTFIK